MTEIREGPATDPVIRQQERDSYKRRRLQLAADTLEVCSASQGQRFLAWLLDDLGMYRKPQFTDSVRLAAFAECRRAVADSLRYVILATGEANWFAIEREMLKRTTVPTNERSKETSDVPNS